MDTAGGHFVPSGQCLHVPDHPQAEPRSRNGNLRHAASFPNANQGPCWDGIPWAIHQYMRVAGRRCVQAAHDR